MPRPYESSPPDRYAEAPPPSDPDEAGERQRAERVQKREAAEQAFRETLKANQAAGVTMPREFRERYERKLGKSRVAELIREFEEPELFSQH